MDIVLIHVLANIALSWDIKERRGELARVCR